MMTVKHITLSGRETVWSAIEATYWPKCAQIPSDDVPSVTECAAPKLSQTIRTYVSVCRPDGDSVRITDGTVFLMNDKGATVSRWDLSGSPVPLRDDVTGSNCHQKMVA